MFYFLNLDTINEVKKYCIKNNVYKDIILIIDYIELSKICDFYKGNQSLNFINKNNYDLIINNLYNIQDKILKKLNMSKEDLENSIHLRILKNCNLPFSMHDYSDYIDYLSGCNKCILKYYDLLFKIHYLCDRHCQINFLNSDTIKFLQKHLNEEDEHFQNFENIQKIYYTITDKKYIVNNVDNNSFQNQVSILEDLKLKFNDEQFTSQDFTLKDFKNQEEAKCRSGIFLFLQNIQKYINNEAYNNQQQTMKDIYNNQQEALDYFTNIYESYDLFYSNQ